MIRQGATACLTAADGPRQTIEHSQQADRITWASSNYPALPAGKPFVLADSYLALLGGGLVIFGTDLYLSSKRRVAIEHFSV